MGSYIFIIKSISLLRYKMPPTEQQTVPLSESTIKSIGDLKTVSKAIKFPVVSDTVKAATDVVTQISENTHVETARQYLQDGIKTLSETEAFTNIQGKVKELNENPRVQEVITNINLKEKVDRLDTIAADGIESLASAVPALRAPTPQLVETAKDTANSYLYLATEYLASFSVAQISLRIAEKTLSLAEGTTDILKSDTEGLMASTSSRIKQVRRAIRAVKRAGERKSILEKDPVARTGIVGSIASLLHMNSILGYLGLRLEAKENESDYNDYSDKETIEPVEVDETDDQDEPVDDGDDNHRHIADLKGDLDGYDSQEDPDYDPEREDKELSEDEKEETVEVREDRDLSEDDKDSEDEAVVEEAKEEETVEVSQDKDLSKDDKYSEDEAVVEEVKEEETVEVRQDKDLSEDDKYSEDEALVEEAVEIEEDTGIQQEQVEVRDSEETNYYGRRPDVNPLLLL